MEDCPDGRMDREKMKQMFNSIMPKVYNHIHNYIFSYIHDYSRCSTQSCPRSYACSMFTIIFKVISFLIFIIIADVQLNHAQGHSHTQYINE